MSVSKGKRRRDARRRRGMSTLEVILTTGVVFPGLVFVVYAGIQVCRLVFSLIGTMSGSPIL